MGVLSGFLPFGLLLFVMIFAEHFFDQAVWLVTCSLISSLMGYLGAIWSANHGGVWRDLKRELEFANRMSSGDDGTSQEIEPGGAFSEKYLGRSIVSGKALAAGWLSHLEMQRTRG